MSQIKYCKLCQRNVEPTKEFNWLIFIFLCGLFYLPLYLAQPAKCPVCKGTQFAPARSGA
jgi:hypothetical protein